MKKCKLCGNTENYYAKNMCRKCYFSRYNKTLTAKRIKQRYYEKVLKNSEKWKIISRIAMSKMRLRRYFGLSAEEYERLSTKCAVCGFDKIVELHHKDRNRKNNNISNLIPLCPNHHRMAHMGILIFDDDNNK